LCLKCQGVPEEQWETVLVDVLHSIRSLLCTLTNTWMIFFLILKMSTFVAHNIVTSTFAKACEDLEKWSTVQWSWAYPNKPDLCSCQVPSQTRDDCLVARPCSMSRATSHRFWFGTFCTAITICCTWQQVTILPTIVSVMPSFPTDNSDKPEGEMQILSWIYEAQIEMQHL